MGFWDKAFQIAKDAGINAANSLNENANEIRQLKDKYHIRETLKLFSSEFNLSTVPAQARKARNETFKPREAPRMVLNILRTAGVALTSRELTDRILEAKGLEATQERIAAVQKSILAVLAMLVRQLLVRELETAHGPRRWKTA